jgi:hypothetical protein
MSYAATVWVTANARWEGETGLFLKVAISTKYKFVRLVVAFLDSVSSTLAAHHSVFFSGICCGRI